MKTRHKPTRKSRKALAPAKTAPTSPATCALPAAPIEPKVVHWGERVAWPPEVGCAVTMFSTGHGTRTGNGPDRGWEKIIGSGWRYLTVIKTGRKWVTLFSVAGLHRIQLSAAQWEDAKPRAYRANYATQARDLERNASVADQYGLQYSRSCVDLHIAIAKRMAECGGPCQVPQPEGVS